MLLIVGIGASAGGLEAFKSFFTNTPADTGMAFVLVQHLSPDHKSMLAELLGKATSMNVIEAGQRHGGEGELRLRHSTRQHPDDRGRMSQGRPSRATA